MDFGENTLFDDKYLSELDLAVEEPTLTKARQNAELYNQVLAGMIPTNEDTRYIVEDLDESMGEFVSCTAKVTGRFTYRDVLTSEFVERFIEDFEVTFNGFALSSPQLDEINEPVVGMQVGYHIIIGAKLLYPDHDDIGDGDLIAGTMKLDTIIDFDGVSFDRAQSWLTHSYPDIVDAIDHCVLNPDESDESNRILNLKGFEIENIDGEDTDTLRMYLQIYLNTVFPLDQGVPYSCTINGEAFQQDANGENREVELKTGTDALLMHLDHFIVPLVEDERGQKKMSVYMSTRSLSPDYTASELVFHIPIESFSHIMSLRHAYYS